MRYLSIPGTVVLFLWDYTPVLAWLGLFGLLGSRITAYVSIPLGFCIGIGVAAAIALWYGLRPARKALQIRMGMMLAASWSRALMEAGVWALMRVGYRYWPQDTTDFVGIASLHRVWDGLGKSGKTQMRDILVYLEAGSPVANEARSFLEEVLPADSLS